MSKHAPPADQPVIVRHWWLIALLAALCGVGLFLLVSHWPTSRWTWAFAIGLFIFAFVAIWLLTGWYRRMAAALFAMGGASALVPSLALHFQWRDEAILYMATEGAPWVTSVSFLVGAFLAWLDYQSRRQGSFGLTSGKAIATGAHGQAAVQQAENLSNSPGNVVGDVHYHQQMTSEYAALNEKLVSHLVDQSERKDVQIAGLEADTQFLSDALARVTEQAKHDDQQAADALSEAHESGDVSKLMFVLIRTADQLQADVEQQLDEFIEVCLEIAAIAYMTGDIDEARARIDTILSFRPNDQIAINRLAAIHLLQGNLVEAEQMWRKLLELSVGNPSWLATGYGNLGVVYNTRGDLDQAEQMFQESLTIAEQLGCKESMAGQYGNLGNVYRSRSDLDQAEQMYVKSLKITEELGLDRDTAVNCDNLGNVYLTRGDIVQAERLYRKSLTINEQLNFKEGIAASLSNLGNVYEARDELDQAEQAYVRALKINEELGRKEGMALQYGGLGNIYSAQGDLVRGEQMLLKSLDINIQMDRKEGVAIQYVNLGIIYGMRSDREQAEQMFVQALEIHEQLGCKEGVAAVHANLGKLYMQHHDRTAARKAWQEARRLYTEIGIPGRVAEIDTWLKHLDESDGAAPGDKES